MVNKKKEEYEKRAYFLGGIAVAACMGFLANISAELFVSVSSPFVLLFTFVVYFVLLIYVVNMTFKLMNNAGIIPVKKKKK